MGPGGNLYVAQVANGGIPNPFTYDGVTCYLPQEGYGVIRSTFMHSFHAFQAILIAQRGKCHGIGTTPPISYSVSGNTLTATFTGGYEGRLMLLEIR
jgi:hypothetical protein